MMRAAISVQGSRGAPGSLTLQVLSLPNRCALWGYEIRRSPDHV